MAGPLRPWRKSLPEDRAYYKIRHAGNGLRLPIQEDAMRKTAQMMILCMLLTAAGCQTRKDFETSHVIRLVSIEKADEFDSGFVTYSVPGMQLIAVQTKVFAPDTISAVMDSIRLSGASESGGVQTEWSNQPIAAGSSITSLVSQYHIKQGTVTWEDGRNLKMERNKKEEPAVLIMAGDTVHVCLGFAVPENVAPDMRLVFAGDTVRGAVIGSGDHAEKDVDSGR